MFSELKSKRLEKKIMKDITLHKGFTVHMGPNGNSVSVDVETALKAIGQAYGLCQKEYPYNVVVAGLPEVPALELQRDMADERSNYSHWDTVKIITTDPKAIEAFKSFQTVMEYIRGKEMEKK